MIRSCGESYARSVDGTQQEWQRHLEEVFRLFDLGHVRGARNDVNFAPLISAATRLPLSTEVSRSCSPQITSVGQVGVRSDGGAVSAICRRAATKPIEAA